MPAIRVFCVCQQPEQIFMILGRSTKTLILITFTAQSHRNSACFFVTLFWTTWPENIAIFINMMIIFYLSKRSILWFLWVSCKFMQDFVSKHSYHVSQVHVHGQWLPLARQEMTILSQLAGTPQSSSVCIFDFRRLLPKNISTLSAIAQFTACNNFLKRSTDWSASDSHTTLKRHRSL